MALDIITIGSATRDVFLTSSAFQVIKSDKSPTGSFECLPYGAKIDIDDIVIDSGGGSTNAGVSLSRFGLKTAVLTRVGNDDDGKAIIKELKREKIATKFVQVDKKEHTAYSTILLSNLGDRSILVHRGASKTIGSAEISWGKLQAKWIYVSSLGGDLSLLKKIVNHANKFKIKVAVNFGRGELSTGFKELEPIIKKLDVLIINREEAATLAGCKISEINKIVQKICPLVKESVVITDGKRGAYACADNNFYKVAATPDKPVNTTGAGDAFSAGFMAGYLLRNDFFYALRLGVLNSGKVVTKTGAKRGLLPSVPSDQRLAKIKAVKKKI